MDGIKLKDLIIMTKYIRFEIDFAERQIGTNSDERYQNSLRKKVENLKPSLERCEAFIDGLTVSITETEGND